MRTCLATLLIALVPALAAADLTFFTDPTAFELFNGDQGYTLGIGTESLEENTMGTGEIHGHSDPLVQGVANGWFPTGLAYDLQIQSNTLGGNANLVSPRGANGLVAIALGAGYGEVSDIVLANTMADSYDLILPAGGSHYSISFDAISLFGDPVNVQVYDANDNLLGEALVDAGPAGTFIGVGLNSGARNGVARINLYAPQVDAEGADNINVYVPEPTTLTLLLAAALLGWRRR